MTSVSPSLKYHANIIPHPELDRWELSLYQKLLPPSCNSLIDLGCGVGDFLTLAKKQFITVIGVDLNESAVKLCQRKNLFVKKQDAAHTKFKNHTFDIVRAQNILEHLSQPEKLLIEAKRILKRDGYLVIHAPTHFSTLYPITNFWDDYTHIRPFTKRGIYRLLTDFNFQIIYFKGYTVGRNPLETVLGKILEKFIPFGWFVIARKI